MNKYQLKSLYETIRNINNLYAEKRYKIINTAFPTILVKENNEIEYCYDIETQGLLDWVDERHQEQINEILKDNKWVMYGV